MFPMPTKQKFLILFYASIAALLSVFLPACSPTTQAISYFPSHAQAKARCIIQRESGGDPQARSATGDHGLFQINYVAHHRAFESRYHVPFFPNIYSVSYNARYARYLYDVAGWSPWNGGRYAC